MKKNDENWEIIGRVAVDSGSVVLGDPCYFLGEKSVARQLFPTWGSVLDVLYENKLSERGNAPLAFGKGCEGLGLVVNTLHGDGCYAVQARRNERGRIVEIKISFE